MSIRFRPAHLEQRPLRARVERPEPLHYRGPVLVDPARPDTGVDLARVAHADRRAVALDRARREVAKDARWHLGLAILATILLFVMLAPAFAWLADGAPDRRDAAPPGPSPAPADLLDRAEAPRVAP